VDLTVVFLFVQLIKKMTELIERRRHAMGIHLLDYDFELDLALTDALTGKIRTTRTQKACGVDRKWFNFTFFKRERRKSGRIKDFPRLLPMKSGEREEVVEEMSDWGDFIPSDPLLYQISPSNNNHSPPNIPP